MSRTVETAAGRYVERDVRPGVVEREWLDGGSRSRIAAPTGYVRIAEGHSRATPATSSTTDPEFFAQRSMTPYVVSLSATAQGDMEREAQDVSWRFETTVYVEPALVE